MKDIRTIVREQLLAQMFTTIKGMNGRYIQYQGEENGELIIAEYDINGWWVNEVDVETALDYILEVI